MAGLARPLAFRWPRLELVGQAHQTQHQRVVEINSGACASVVCVHALHTVRTQIDIAALTAQGPMWCEHVLDPNPGRPPDSRRVVDK